MKTAEQLTKEISKTLCSESHEILESLGRVLDGLTDADCNPLETTDQAMVHRLKAVFESLYDFHGQIEDDFDEIICQIEHFKDNA